MAFKDYTTICNGAPSEVLGLIALQNWPTIVNRNLEIIRANMDIATDVFTRYIHQLDWIAPQAGSIAFPQWTGTGDVEEFCRQMLERYSVMIVPGSMFDHPGNHFRLGLGRRNFKEGMTFLEEFLQTA
jgi:aspartate/methionine/tyrosine aminotransferase